MNLLYLEDDCFSGILAHLSIRDLLNVSQCCTRLRSLILDDDIWHARAVHDFSLTPDFELPIGLHYWRTWYLSRPRLVSLVWDRELCVRALVYSQDSYLTNTSRSKTEQFLSTPITRPRGVYTWQLLLEDTMFQDLFVGISSGGSFSLLLDVSSASGDVYCGDRLYPGHWSIYDGDTLQFLLDCSVGRWMIYKGEDVLFDIREPRLKELDEVRVCVRMSPVQQTVGFEPIIRGSQAWKNVLLYDRDDPIPVEEEDTCTEEEE